MSGCGCGGMSGTWEASGSVGEWVWVWVWVWVFTKRLVLSVVHKGP